MFYFFVFSFVTVLNLIITGMPNTFNDKLECIDEFKKEF